MYYNQSIKQLPSLVSLSFIITDYEQLFQQMNKVQGPAEMKCHFVRAIIHEALRFKKRILANLLQQFEQSIVQMESNNKVTVNHVR